MRLIVVATVVLLAVPAAGRAQDLAPPDGPSVAGPPAATTDVSPAPTVGSLFTSLPRDLVHLASVDSAVILGVGGAAAAIAHPYDARTTRTFVGSPGLDTLFEPGAVLGGGSVQVGSALAVYAIGRLGHSDGAARLGADLVRGQLVNTVLTQGFKLAARRERPNGGAFSFPSGHASATFTTAAVLQRHLGWKVGVPAYGLAAYVAGSRLQENRHYLSDVIFGAAMGMVAGRTVSVGHGPARFSVTPFAGPDGAGVGFSLLPRSQ